MPLTSPIPKAAMPAVLLIREKVKRPEDLPDYNGFDGLRWGDFCPLGLLPRSKSDAPYFASETGEKMTDKACESFHEWWDRQTDPVAARDAVWPREGE